MTPDQNIIRGAIAAIKIFDVDMPPQRRQAVSEAIQKIIATAPPTVWQQLIDSVGALPLTPSEMAAAHMPEESARKSSRTYEMQNGQRWVQDGVRPIYGPEDVQFERPE